MPRLGAKKSRNGCVQCKARRVKCDEQRPCGACAKHHVECSLLGRPGAASHVLLPSPHTNAPSPHALTPPISSEPVRSPAASAGEGPITPTSTFSSSTNQYGTVPTQVVLPPLPSSQWMHDLELMHHYTAHAYLTLPGVQSTKEIWGYAVPQEAFKFPYLMHSILAFSANHLVYLKPSKSAHYRVLASTHQSIALTSLQSTITEIQIANCQAVFVSALLAIYNAFADAQIHSLDVLFDLFQVVRGMNIVSDRRIHIIREGPFAAIIAPTPNPPTPQPLLSSILVELQAAEGQLHDGATPTQIACMKATTLLRQTLKHAMETTPHPALRAMLYWPNVLDAEFLEMLKHRSDPCVHEILVRYCQIMEFAASSFWFMDGWRGISQRT